MHAHRVSRRVNKPGNDDSGLLTVVDLTRFSGRVFAIRLCRFAGELSPFEVDW